jgi:MFS family permease
MPMNRTTYRNYLLAVLLVVLAFNCVDRVALGMVLQSIKHDLALSDTQLGFLTGIAFALFYSVMGIPLARRADRGNRITLISVTTAMWSVAVVLCGLAGSFLQLLLIRIGVAIGEAGCMPTANSLIADYFSRPERPRAVARYLLGGPLSLVLGYCLAGWINQYYGWRSVFVILGLPGIGLALLVRLTLKEPRLAQPLLKSTGHAENTPSSDSQPTFADVGRTLWHNKTFRHLSLSYSVTAFFGYGMTQWQPAFFIRSYGLGTAELGVWFAAIYGLAGSLGMYWGGELASRYAPNKEQLQLKVMAAAYVAAGAVSASVYLAPNRYLAFSLMAVSVIASGVCAGPLFAAIQTLVPERMRAQSIALIFLFANLVGMGLGPLAVGAISDVLRSVTGEESLRYSLLVLCPGYLWSAWHVWRAGQTVAGDLQAAAEVCRV